MAVNNSVNPEGWFAEQIGACEPDLLRSMIKTMTEALMSAEADVFCGAPGTGRARMSGSTGLTGTGPGSGTPGRDRRAGHPKLRSGSSFPEWLLERRRRAEQALISVDLLGVSTRRVTSSASRASPSPR